MGTCDHSNGDEIFGKPCIEGVVIHSPTSYCINVSPTSNELVPLHRIFVVLYYTATVRLSISELRYDLADCFLLLLITVLWRFEDVSGGSSISSGFGAFVYKLLIVPYLLQDKYPLLLCWRLST